MEKIGITHRLGEEVFMVQDDGVIIRSAVSSLGRSGCSFLLENRGTAYYDFDKAIDAAETLMKELLESDDITRKAEAAIRARLSQLRTPSFHDEVMDQPLVRGAKMFGAFPERVLSDVTFPTDYFLPGQMVFGLVTPMSHYLFSPGWRPRLYFILPVEVQEVTFSDRWKGNVIYRFVDTSYRFDADRLFLTETAARRGMVHVFAEETGGSIKAKDVPLFHVSEEMAYGDEQRESLLRQAGIRV